MGNYIRRVWTQWFTGRRKPYLYIMTAIIVFFFLGYFGHSYNETDRVTRLTQEIREQVEMQYEERITSLEKSIEGKDKLIQASQKRERIALDALTRLTKERENVKPPQNATELYDRLDALGYRPSSIR